MIHIFSHTDSNKTLGTEKPAQILNESTLKLANEQNPKNPPKAMEAGSDEKASSLTSKNPEAILKGEVVLPSKSAETTIAKDKLFEATIGKNTTETKENFVAKESSAKELLMAKDAQTTGNRRMGVFCGDATELLPLSKGVEGDMVGDIE